MNENTTQLAKAYARHLNRTQGVDHDSRYDPGIAPETLTIHELACRFSPTSREALEIAYAAGAAAARDEFLGEPSSWQDDARG